MSDNGFYALINRMKHISRWSLMRNMEKETIEGHSYQTAIIAHALCLIANKRCGEKLDPERACLLALFHDVPEILTGDMPTPVKYSNEFIREAYGDIEKEAVNLLLDMIPAYLQDGYSFMNTGENEPEWKYVKAADTLSAYIKCREESNMGNREFEKAGEAIFEKLHSLPLPALKIFMEEFLPAYDKTLDELK
jgi:5'-deoxynucleotidase